MLGRVEGPEGATFGEGLLLGRLEGPEGFEGFEAGTGFVVTFLLSITVPNSCALVAAPLNALGLIPTILLSPPFLDPELALGLATEVLLGLGLATEVFLGLATEVINLRFYHSTKVVSHNTLLLSHTAATISIIVIIC